ncbi:uncharacterized protein RHO25_012667 [Cercospora beticola]|uniref:Uncharacterized protein n=1 Tax=Cercospora beticola TaxID=122368 RepID=A0ABZ0P7W3_CERBT|nr:hypothetical protein RHO25_012667 [Cercospora beticola]CAK1368141.1 unnamed protein product [Cercospora beticola]
MAILPGQDVLDNVKGSLKDLIPSANFLYVEACEKGIAGIVEEEDGRPSKLAMISRLIEDISA